MLQSRAHGRKREVRTPKEEAGAAEEEAAAEATGEFHFSFRKVILETSSTEHSFALYITIIKRWDGFSDMDD